MISHSPGGPAHCLIRAARLVIRHYGLAFVQRFGLPTGSESR